MTETVQKLLSTSNFGSGGTVPDAFTITSEAGAITEGLLSQYDVFFIGWFSDFSSSAFSTSELQAMENWVNSGGNLLITSDDQSHDAVAAHFGYPSTWQGVVTNLPEPGQSNHPAFDGPFGAISQYSAGGNMGFFTNTTGATVLARDASGNATLLEKDIGAGKIIVSGDVCTIDNAYLSSGTGISTNNDIYMANLFHYIAGGGANQDPDCSGAAMADQSADVNWGADISGADVTGVTDPDGDDLTITVSPTRIVLGANTVTVTADDGNGGSCSTDITVNVVDDSAERVSGNIKAKSKNTNWDAGASIFSFDLKIKNRKSDPILAPIRIEIESLTPGGPPTITVNNPDGGGNGVGAYWNYSDDVGSDYELSPGEWSDYVRWEFYDPSGVNFYFWAEVYGVLAKTSDPLRFKVEVAPSTGQVKFVEAEPVEQMTPQPEGFQLLASHPNPFSISKVSQTRIPFTLDKAGRVQLEVYNLLGQKVRTLAGDHPMTAGYHEITWNGKDEAGVLSPAGVYLVRLSSGANIQHRKIMMMR